MKVIPYDAMQQTLIDGFQRIGGVVEYVQIMAEPTDGPSQEDRHRRAAIQGVEHLVETTGYSINTSFPRHPSFLQPTPLFTVNREQAQQMCGERITREDFLGVNYPRLERGLLRDASTDGTTGALATVRETGSGCVEGSVDSSKSGASFLIQGYADAFARPPYSLKEAVTIDGTPYTVGELFAAINSALLGGLTEATVYFRWPVDWSNYFDSGKEWWGAFLWTVSQPGSARIVTIVAESSD